MRSMIQRYAFRLTWLLPAFLLFVTGCNVEHPFIKKIAFKDSLSIIIEFAGEPDPDWATDPGNYSVYEKRDPDVHLAISKVILGPDKKTVLIRFDEEINQAEPHVVVLTPIHSQGKDLGPAILNVKRLYIGELFAILIGAMLISNYVFTKYLGLCVFFGTSKKRNTAVGMGITFTIVIVASAMMSWFLYQFVLKPFELDFLQVVVFIGMVSLSVQAVDTVLRKVNPALFKAFGVYLVLVIANCIILAVPLTLANNEYSAMESLMLALGAGTGFLLALFLMSSARERLELADIPPTYRGLPIAFVTAGLFALAFMGFSGLVIF
jgi:electron transport complex protein RnfA